MTPEGRTRAASLPKGEKKRRRWKRTLHPRAKKEKITYLWTKSEIKGGDGSTFQ